MKEIQDSVLYRKLPAIGEYLESAEGQALQQAYSRPRVLSACRALLARLRHEVKSGKQTLESLEAAVDGFSRLIEREIEQSAAPSLRKVINATGVILQTNLGRAPLSEAALQRIQEIASGYCNLEFDLESGERSYRDRHVDELILRAIGSQLTLPSAAPLLETRAAAVVNNCAAATFLALNTLAEGREVIVSRGELVEIGGGFRIPEILAKSGAVLREVGTTNRTRLTDYRAAITPQTGLILRVHRSNFRIEGFTERPELTELVELGRECSLPVFEDQGTGCLVRLKNCGIKDECCWLDSVASGATLVACSGDKLLGGPQCGILVGTEDAIDAIRANPLFRAFRVDKLTYAALEATLLAYVAGNSETIPAIAIIGLQAEAIEARAEAIVSALRSSGLDAGVVPVSSVIGGGTAPGASLPSFAVALSVPGLSESSLAAYLRRLDPPVVTRVSEGRVLLDLRTVPAAEDAVLVGLLRHGLAPIQGAGKEDDVGS